MSCNGCRVLRKGCSESCVLRPCLQWIDSAESQGHATVFVAKFFGRAGLISFISSVPLSQRPALFQSLLYEACGRTINPVDGAVGLLSTGRWNLCQAAVETVLRGGSLKPLPDLDGVGDRIVGWASPDLELYLSAGTDGRKRKPTTSSEEESVTTSAESGVDRTTPRLLNLFI